MKDDRRALRDIECPDLSSASGRLLPPLALSSRPSGLVLIIVPFASLASFATRRTAFLRVLGVLGG
jgi:hypothetical protein